MTLGTFVAIALAVGLWIRVNHQICRYQDLRKRQRIDRSIRLVELHLFAQSLAKPYRRKRALPLDQIEIEL